jgi:chorismate synthase
MGSSFGTLLRLTTYGESHGSFIGGVLDGIPPKIPISIDEIQKQLHRRRPGQSKVSTPRKEKDRVHIGSGLMPQENQSSHLSLGTPIGFYINNQDARSQSYENIQGIYRPSHADFTYDAKYGIRDWRGGGRSSARETACRVVAGAIAQQVLRHFCPELQIFAFVQQIQEIKANVDTKSLHVDLIESNIVRCPDPIAAKNMEQRILDIKSQNDSVGGIIRCICLRVPAGLGDPCFDKLEADLAKAMLSIPATKGFFVGSGFDSIHMTGSQHNDPFVMQENKVQTQSNHSGGIQGGISNGMPICFDVVFKPTATIAKKQQSINQDHQHVELEAKGRHDPCVLPRAVPIVEAMTALVLCEHLLRQRTISRF